MQQHLPIPLPKAKFGSPGDSDEETDEDAPAATRIFILVGVVSTIKYGE